MTSKDTWIYFAQKKANWLTDTFIVSPLTALYARQNDKYRADLAAKAKSAPVPIKSSAPAPSPEKTLRSLAQDVSNHYHSASPAKPKFYHGGKAVVR